MKSIKWVLLILIPIMVSSFDGVASAAQENNVVPIIVNGSSGPLCSANSYLNEPCVSVTVCTPNTATCQTINNILLDTGSFGLRIFQQVLDVSLVQATSGSGSLAECVQYADGSSDWGPVQIAGVILGNEPPVQIPIQVINAAFATTPSGCQNADQSPTAVGFNGILGVGLFIQDCGSGCTSSANNGIYYSCNGSICRGAAVALSSQVQNPVAFLPQDNNGVIVQLPSIPAGGSVSVNGNLVLGIGTQSNNNPSGLTAYGANQLGEFLTNFNGTSYSSFIDSGSNGLFFTPPRSLLPSCPSPNSFWFCPSSTTSFSATNTGASGSPSGVVSFQIGNFDSLINSSNNVFSDIGGAASGFFDWGLSFFFGKGVVVGIDGKGSVLGAGPYWAYGITNSPPSVSTTSPMNSTTPVGTLQTFTIVYSDPDGYQNIAAANFYMSGNGGAINQWLHYFPAPNQFTIMGLNDSCIPGQVKTLSNGSLSFNCATSTVTGSGTNLTIVFKVTPLSGGINYTFFNNVSDQAGGAFTTEGGTWQIP